jgi:hypothetical protein
MSRKKYQLEFENKLYPAQDMLNIGLCHKPDESGNVKAIGHFYVCREELVEELEQEGAFVGLTDPALYAAVTSGPTSEYEILSLSRPRRV